MALGHCCSQPQRGHDEGKSFQTLQRSSLLCLGGGSTWAFSKHNLHRLLLEMCCLSRLVQAISNSATLHRRSSHTKLLRHVPQAEGRNGWYPFSFGSPPRGLWSSHWAFWTLHRLLCSRDETLDRSLAQRCNDLNDRLSNWKNVIENQYIDMFNFTDCAFTVVNVEVLQKMFQKQKQFWPGDSCKMLLCPADRSHQIQERDLPEHLTLEGFRWSIGLVSRVLVRTILEGSTAVMQAVYDGNLFKI